jgi:predicted nucleotidyltransferase
MQNKQYPVIDNSLSEIKENILTTLAYFDLFSYPLTRGEIYMFLQNKYEYDAFDDSLRCLLDSRFIHKFDAFYTLKNDQYLIVRRNEGNLKATELIKIAKKVADILIRFPYVRGIAISGSLSKNYADEYSDIDLFIITTKNRLWIARTIMHCFKKLTFLVRKEDYFCMNYYIDEQQLEIPEKNIYTAIEIGTLIPLQGDAVFEKFYAANAWTRAYLPNKNMRVSSAKPIKMSFLKNIAELLLNNAVGNIIDNILMKVTASRWLKKTSLKKLNSHGAVMAMKTSKYFSKPDPENFQSKLLTKYEGKISQVLRQYESSLVH